MIKLSRIVGFIALAAVCGAGPSMGMGADRNTSRLVVLGGAATEVIYAFGLEEAIVGIDTTSIFPPETAKVAKVGYLRTLSAEGILSLRPTLVIATEDAGPPNVLSQLREVGTDLLILPGKNDFPGLHTRIQAIGAALGREQKAQEMIASIDAKVAALNNRLLKASTKPRVLALLAIGGGGAPQAAGQGTAAEAIVELAGGVNTVQGYQGYKPLTPEAAIVARPDVILTTTESVAAFGGIEKLRQHPALKLMSATEKGRILQFEGTELLGFGPRLPETLQRLVKDLHPDLDLALSKP